MQTTAKNIEYQIKAYARDFLLREYGEEAARKLEMIEIKAINTYDNGGVSERTEKDIKIAAKRDFLAGKLTDTTKLIVRHEIGHLLDDNSPDFPEYSEIIEHEKIAWKNAKVGSPAHNWYKNLSIRTHVDPLKMQSMGFPRPETKIPKENLNHGINVEIKRMGKYSPLVDRDLATRYAMAKLIENPDFYHS